MRRRLLLPFAATSLVLIVSLAAMIAYAHNVLGDQLDNHMLSSRMFGLPEKLLDHGLRPFYQGPKETGWDGQFYYDIANDPLARADTAAHLDADAYRYQRVGLPLLAWIVGKLTLQDWVSPLTFYLTNLGVVLLATFVGASFFQRAGIGSWWIVFWSLSLGVQITLLNALPDGAADALLLMALVCLFSGRLAGFAIFASLASLSREAYVVVPVVFGGAGLWRSWSLRRASGTTASAAPLVASASRWIRSTGWSAMVPIAIFCTWQLFVRLRFHHSPASQAHGILAPPFESWFRYFAMASQHRHAMAPGALANWEVGALGAFALLLLSNAWLALRAVGRSDAGDVATRTVALSLLILAGLYACFGDAVMASYTGYMKAANVFILAVPFLLVWAGSAGRVWFFFLFFVTDAMMGIYLVHDRFDVSTVALDRYLRTSQVVSSDRPPCLTDHRAHLDLKGVGDLRSSRGLLSRIVGHRTEVLEVAVTNDSEFPYRSSIGAGSVNMSYRWLAADGAQVVKDGIRSFMPDGLAAHATTIVPLVVDFPDEPGRYVLRLSLVQEGCDWFYGADPSSKRDLDYVVR